MADDADFTDVDLLLAGRGFARLFAAHKYRFVATMQALPAFDERLSERLERADDRYARQLGRLDDTFRSAIDRLTCAQEPGTRLVTQFLRAWKQHALKRDQALAAARKRHPEVKRRTGRPASPPETGLARGLRLYWSADADPKRRPGRPPRLSTSQLAELVARIRARIDDHRRRAENPFRDRRSVLAALEEDCTAAWKDDYVSAGHSVTEAARLAKATTADLAPRLEQYRQKISSKVLRKSR
jgi:hypothetical protein